MATRSAALVLAAAVMLTTSCGGDGGSDEPPQSTVPPSLSASAAGTNCPSDVVDGTQVRFGVNGASDLGGVVFGTGTVGIVFANQSNATVCNWAGYARELAGRGYRTLAFDYSGWGASAGARNTLAADVGAAVSYLRGRGVATVVLIGASMGGTAALVAASQVQPPVAGAISVSAPRAWLNANAGQAVPKLAVPVLYLVGDGDNAFAEDARAMHDRTPAAVRKLVVVHSASHGVNLLDGQLAGSEEAANTVRAEIDAFLAKVAPVR